MAQNNIREFVNRFFKDSHWTLPSEIIPSRYFVGITNDNKLVTLTKSANAAGELLGFLMSANPLPEDFEPLWCRIFFRHQRALALVMSVNRQDFFVCDVEFGSKEGEWTLHEPLPDDSWLMSVQSIDDETLFSITYTLDNNEHSLECLYPVAAQGRYAA